MGDRISGYAPERTVTQEGVRWHYDLIERMAELNEESAYGMSEETVVTVVLAGGGPSFVVRFGFDPADGEVWDSEPLWAETAYSEPFESPVVVPVQSGHVEPLWESFRRPADDEG